MCGIAGYSLSQSPQDPTLFGQLLLVGVAERGNDATGFAYRSGNAVDVHKWVGPLHRHLGKMQIPVDTHEAIFHVREYTKGNPGIMANNHPIQHGHVFGVHNGVIINDEQLFRDLGEHRAEEDMTVDSEAIFMLLDRCLQPWNSIVGTYTASWLDDRSPSGVGVMKGRGRPLYLAQVSHGYVWASTKNALDYALYKAQLDVISMIDIAEGTYMYFENGEMKETLSFDPKTDEDYIIPVYPLDDPEAIIARRAMENILATREES